VLKEQIERTNTSRNDAALARMRALVDEGVKVLAGAEPISAFGDLLHESWQLKQSLSSAIANPAIVDAYETGRAAGAIGGKLLGAGGGGFLLFFAPPERHAALRQALRPMKELNFELEQSGSQIIFFHD
jgi:D-glycero-alpha-D-manno-heptose-7-phosphate kinase